MSRPDRIKDPLPILGEDGAVFQYGDYKRMPPQNQSSSQSRRTPTPTKQVSLRSVSRREEDSQGYEETIDMEELRQSLSRENSRIYEPQVEEENIQGANSKVSRKAHSCNHNDGNKKPPFVVSSNASIPPPKSVKAPLKPKEKPPLEGATGGEESEDSSSSDSEEEEERRAPSQLLMEFLECLMKKEYVVAAKLCKMILIYEPNHPTALQFQPVLEEKILIEQEKENESGSDESGDDDDESDDSGEDSDEESEDSDSEEEENDDRENEEDRNSADEFFDEFKQDSGIASASSD